MDCAELKTSQVPDLHLGLGAVLTKDFLVNKDGDTILYTYTIRRMYRAIYMKGASIQIVNILI